MLYYYYYFNFNFKVSGPKICEVQNCTIIWLNINTRDAPIAVFSDNSDFPQCEQLIKIVFQRTITVHQIYWTKQISVTSFMFITSSDKTGSTLFFFFSIIFSVTALILCSYWGSYWACCLVSLISFSCFSVVGSLGLLFQLFSLVWFPSWFTLPSFCLHSLPC